MILSEAEKHAFAEARGMQIIQIWQKSMPVQKPEACKLDLI